LTDEIALAEFLRAKVGFTFLVGGDMERRRLAGTYLLTTKGTKKLGVGISPCHDSYDSYDSYDYYDFYVSA